MQSCIAVGGNPVLTKLKSFNQVPHPNAQSLRDFHQIIERRRFNSPFNPADEHRGEVGFLRQLLLTECSLFPFDSDGLAQQAAVLLDCQHGQFKEHEPQNAAMSVTTSFADFACISLGKGSKAMVSIKLCFVAGDGCPIPVRLGA